MNRKPTYLDFASGKIVEFSASDQIPATNVSGVTGGGGDMLKSVYDTNNDGIVNEAAILNGQNGVYYLSRANHSGSQSADTLTNGTTNKVFLATEQTKLAGIATGATANSSDAVLEARANHTGTQGPATIVQDSSNRFVTDAEKATWNGKQGTIVCGQASVPFASFLTEDRVTVSFSGILIGDQVLLSIAATSDDVYAQDWDPPITYNYQTNSFDIVLRPKQGVFKGSVKVNYQIIPIAP